MTDTSNSPALQRETVNARRPLAGAFEPRASFTLPGKKTAPPPKKRRKNKGDKNWKPLA